MKQLSYTADVLHSDRHESLLLVDSIFSMGFVRRAQITRLNLQYLRDILKECSDITLNIF